MEGLTNQKMDELFHKGVTLLLHDGNVITGNVIDVTPSTIHIVIPGDAHVKRINVGEIKEIIYISEENKNYESNDNMVSHPPHYQSATGLEVIDVIEAFTADLTGIEATDTGNVLKYACRWKRKNGLQDLKKAMWYLTHLINHVEKSEKECN